MSKDRRYFHTELAFNYRLTNLQAALGFAQLTQIETFIQKKRQIFEWYRDGLESVESFDLNIERPGYRNIFWMISLVLSEEKRNQRDEICAKLKTHGIDTRPFFVAMSRLPHLASLKQIGASDDTCQVSVALAAGGFSLPSGCNLTREDVRRVVEVVNHLGI